MHQELQNKIELKIIPVPKPRMTIGDKWKNRPAVIKYWNYKRNISILINNSNFVMPECNYHLTFILPMPKSWSKKKKLNMDGKPHQSEKADKDNLEKAFLDAVCKKDGHIWDGRVTKIWGREGRIILEW